MSRKKKTMLCVLLCMSLMFSSLSVFAQNASGEDVECEVAATWTLQGENEEKESYNVSEEMPTQPSGEGISLFGTGYPNTYDCINLLYNSRYDFYGEAKVSDLYTDKCFTGQSQFRVFVMNFKTNETMKVKLMKFTGIGSIATAVHTQTVYANGGVAYTIYNLDSDAIYFLKFEAPSHFEGYIE